jgi:hypothetical protein
MPSSCLWLLYCAYAKTLLHLLLKVSDLVVRLENMLLIPPPADEIPSTTSTFEQLVHVRENHGVSTSQRGSLGNAGEEEGILPERAALNRAKHLGRIAAEYSQLLYHAEKARTQHCIFVDQLQKVSCLLILSTSNLGSECWPPVNSA